MKRSAPIVSLIIGVILLFGLILIARNSVHISSTPPDTATPTTSKQTNSADTSPSISLNVPSGFSIKQFADSLGNPRDLVFSPGGTLLVSNPSSNDVIALPDRDHNGAADSEHVVISGGNHPHGLSFYGGKLFVAETTRVIRYSWNEKTLTATRDKILFALPENNDHNNRTIAFDASGNLYVSVGSTCNVCREQSDQSATVMISNSNGDNPHIFAKGLRNAAFLALNPLTRELWGTEMGRDYLGDTVPSDEINIIRQGKNYGWPNCYGNKIHDKQFDRNTYIQDPCLNTEKPTYEIPAHSAPLGLAFIQSSQFPTNWQNDLLVAYHGSWNRTSKIGYKVVHLTVSGNTITNSQDFLTGFLNNQTILGRPVDLIFDQVGNLYISDDKTGAIYIISKK